MLNRINFTHKDAVFYILSQQLSELSLIHSPINKYRLFFFFWKKNNVCIWRFVF